MEHLAIAAPFTLRTFCDRCRQILSLPKFFYDSENETEWGIAEMQNIEYNISRPYETGLLQKWDDTVPDGCNFGVSLVLYETHPNANDHEWVYSNLVTPVAQKLSDGFAISVHYHRTWLGVGNNQQRNKTFSPIVK